MFQRVAFDDPTQSADGLGGVESGWTEVIDKDAAEFIYDSGSEVVEAAKRVGQTVFKVRLHSHTKTRALTTDSRMRDLATNKEYNIRTVDADTDRAWVWLWVESGAAA